MVTDDSDLRLPEPTPRDGVLVAEAIYALAREVRRLREEVALVHGVADDVGSALERCIGHLADVTENR